MWKTIRKELPGNVLDFNLALEALLEKYNFDEVELSKENEDFYKVYVRDGEEYYPFCLGEAFYNKSEFVQETKEEKFKRLTAEISKVQKELDEMVGTK